MRIILAVLATALFGIYDIARADGDALYSAGRGAWESEDWRDAYGTLREYRLLKYGKRPDVDYMLGTSACRIDGLRTWGGNALHSMLYSYPLTIKSRRIVTEEMLACRGAPASGEETLQLALIDWPPAGMNAVFKTFYWSDDTQPVASYPMRRVKSFERSYFTKRLVRLGEMESALAKAAELSPFGRAFVSDRLILISESGHSKNQLEEIAGRLDGYVEYLTDDYGIGTLEHYVTIYLLPDSYQVAERAMELHGLDVSGATLGYAYADDLSLIAFVPGQATGTVLHELFHLMVRSDYGNIPQWLDEGIASLYEVSVTDGAFYWGVDNWRGQVLQRLWDDYRPTVEQLVRSDWYLFDDPAQAEAIEASEQNPDELIFREEESARQAAMMAFARYFALYLQDQGKLRDVFEKMQSNDLLKVLDREVDPRDHAVAVVQASLGIQNLDQIDQAFADWFLSGAAAEVGRPADPDATIEKELPGQVFEVVTGVNVRRGPGLAFDRISGLSAGERIEVLTIENGWAEIRLQNDARGYVFAQYLSQVY